MIRIDCTHCLLKARIKSWQANVFWVAWFVDGIIACYPRISSIPRGNLLPQPDYSVLMVFKVPEAAVVGRTISMPIWTLTAWHSVHIKDGVYVFLGALLPSISLKPLIRYHD